MKIGLDAKRAFLNNTGLGNYSRNVIKSLVTRYPQHTYYLFTPQIGTHPFYDEMKGLPQVHFITPKNKFLHAYWRSYGITRLINKLELDIYHGLSNELPFNIFKTNAKKVVTIHDLIPFKEDAFRNIVDDFFAKIKMRRACKYADMVTPISEATLNDIRKVFGTEAKKMQVVYQPVGFEMPSIVPDVINKFQLPSNYILQVGTVEYRKNIQIIIRALLQLKQPDLHYVIVGRKKPFYKSLVSYASNHGLGSHLHFIDPVSNDDLAGIYKASAAVVYPSLYEGFGLPIIEAIAFGKPVLTTMGGCFEEAGGKGAYYCNTQVVDEVALTLGKMLNADNTQLILAGQQHIAQFTLKATADGLMQVYTH